jgi:hypothetical protein
MNPTSGKPLERLRYWQGQALLSRDFRDQERLDARRRELHNRALHDVPGVVTWHPEPDEFGLEVFPRTDGKPGFTVSCGAAYDCAGRLLLLQQARDVDPPATSARLVLKIRPAASLSECWCAPTDDGCPLPQAAAAENDAELTWRPLDSLGTINGVVLARVRIDGGGAVLEETFHRRSARPIARARLARGETVRGNTPWERWEIDEPDGQGGLKKRVVGVQTHIDTSAAGFTDTPNYFAILTSPGWDLAKTEFAPAFFAHVSEPTVDGFIFRLLMMETARRKYNALSETARVTETRRLSGDRLQFDVDSAARFRKNDVVALLRPRGDVAFRIAKASAAIVTLESALPATVDAETMLAVGHAPRVSKVVSVTPGDPTVLVLATSAVVIKKNDVLMRLSDNAVTIVNSAGTKGLTVREPFPAWTKDQPIGFAPRSTAVAVKNSQTDAAKTTIVLTTKTHNIVAPSMVVGLDSLKKPMGAVGNVTAVADDTLVIKPPLTDAALDAIEFVSMLRKNVTVTEIEPQNSGVVVEVDNASPFSEGDFVAGLGDVSAITVVDKVSVARNELSLRDAIPLSAGSVIAAADWIGATAVELPAVAGNPSQIVVGRAGAVPVPSFLVREEADGFSSPHPVVSVAGQLVTLTKPFEGLTRLDTLAVGVFPRIATVVGVEPGGVRIAEAGALYPGDVLIQMSAAAGPTDMAEVVSAAGNFVQLQKALGNVTPGVTQLGVVAFTDATQVVQVPVTTPQTVKVDKELEVRPGDFVAVLTHYADNSNAGTISEIKGQTITLAGPGIASGDGIVAEDFIDGGIIGPAAVSAFAQPLVRLESSDGLGSGARQATAFGYDLLTHQFISQPVWVFLADSFIDGVPPGTMNRIYVWPASFGAAYRYRPETLALITLFNADFPAAFATFAQKQNLAVDWMGCQQEFPPPSGCPGLLPATGCCGSSEG